MRRVIAGFVASLALVSAPAATAGAPTPPEAEALGREAYRYGFPLLEVLRVRAEQTSVACPDRMGNAPVNSFSHAGGFTRPEDRTVVAPNTDTLYSIAHLDLRRGPMVLRHPNMGDRYFVFELVDPYTDVIDYVGTRTTGSKAGRYAISWSGSKRRAPKGIPVIRSKFRRVWVIGRTLATDARDQRRAQKLMRRFRLSRAGKPPRRFDSDCSPGRPAVFPTPTEGAAFLAKLARALDRNPPPRRDRPLLDRLDEVGIGPGETPADAGLPADVEAALLDGVTAEAAELPGRIRAQALAESIAAGGWLTLDDDIGDYGTDYDLRARVAVVGLGANTVDEAIYPTAIADSGGALLNGANTYRLVFGPGQVPPVRYFWSLTMYDLNGFLVPNPIDRYSLGPTHPPLERAPDGTVEAVVSHDPPSQPGVNWLPAPDGNFRLNLRLFGPRGRALDGRWVPPPVVRTG